MNIFDQLPQSHLTFLLSPVQMSRPSYKTKSDTMLLRRLINNLKERGSEVAGELERKAHNFLTDVQMKRKPKVCPAIILTDSDTQLTEKL